MEFKDGLPEDEVLASLDQYENFIESSVWKDFKGVLVRRSELYQMTLRSCTPEDLTALQAALKELEFFTVFPERMLEMLNKLAAEKEDEEETDE